MGFDGGDMAFEPERAEGIAENTAFRATINSRRCLVPADGFYEWQATPGRKLP